MSVQQIDRTSASPSSARPATEESPPASDPVKIAKIMVGIDFSDFSLAALKYAAALAQKLGASLTVVHFVEPCIYPEDLSAGLSIEEVEARWFQNRKEKLEEFLGGYVPRSVPMTALVIKGSAWHELVEAAKSEDADLIVLGTHGRTGIQHALMGSTAERVVRHAECPVLVIHKEAA